MTNATLAGLAPQAPRQSNSRAERISAGCLAAPRSAVPRAHYLKAVHLLAVVGDAQLLRPPLRAGPIGARLRALLPSLTQPAAADAVQFVLTGRERGSLVRWIRRHRELVARIVAEVSP